VARRKGRYLLKLTMSQREALIGVLLILPALAYIFIFVINPLFNTVKLSFFSQNLLLPQKGTQFVWLKNYQYLVKKNIVLPCFLRTFLLSIGTIGPQLVIGLFIALMLDRPFKFRGLVRASFIIPWATPTLVASYIIRWAFDAQYGLVNNVLRTIGFPIGNFAWLGRADLALLAVTLGHIWKGLGLIILVILAGLQAIPTNIRDAARIDGASPWQYLCHIILPFLKYIIIIIGILRFIWTFNWFDLVFLVTSGGPGESTMTMPVKTYIYAFKELRMGRGACMATFMVVLLVVIAFAFLRIMFKKGETY